MTFKFNLGDTLRSPTTTPVTIGVVHARTEYLDTTIQPAYQLRWRDSSGRKNRVWFDEDKLEPVG